MTKLKNPQRDCISTVNGTMYFDWESAGFKPQGWPAVLKEAGSTTIPVAKLCDYFGDPLVNPSGGGVIGKANIASELGVTERQLQREVACGSASFIRRHGSLWASNVQSLDAFRCVNDSGRAEAWSNNSCFHRNHSELVGIAE